MLIVLSATFLSSLATGLDLMIQCLNLSAFILKMSSMALNQDVFIFPQALIYSQLANLSNELALS